MAVVATAARSNGFQSDINVPDSFAQKKRTIGEEGVFKTDIGLTNEELDLGGSPLVELLEGSCNPTRAQIREAVAKETEQGMSMSSILQTPTSSGWPLLIFAAQRGMSDAVLALLELGADVESTEPASGWTALMYAAANGNQAMVRDLLAHGASPGDPEAVFRHVADVCSGEAELRDRLAELLTQGCDERIVINPKTGMHKYNGTNRPVPGSVRRSSCTFSVPTEDMFAEGVAALRHLEANEGEADASFGEVCQRLMAVWKIAAGTGITLFPSGTDAEFLPFLVGLCRAMKAGGKLASIITATGEVGSGTNDAAIGRHFSPLLPAQHQCPEHKVGGSIFPEGSIPDVDTILLKLRNAEGARYSIEDLDQFVRDAVAKALGEDGYSVVVVHVVAGSKTGSIMPSLHVVSDLLSEYGDRVMPVIDACQTRMQDAGLQSLIQNGMPVLVTGSKFYGGPPFCGAALLPKTMVEELNEALSGGVPSFRDAVAASDLKAYISGSLVAPELTALREVLPIDVPNLGLLLRWQMALYQIEQYHSIPEADRDRIVQSWMDQFADVVKSKASPAVSIFEDSREDSSPSKCRARSSTVDAIIDCGMIKMKTINMLELKKRVGIEDDGTERWGRLSLDEMKKVHTLMATDVSGKDGWPEDPVLAKQIFIAQPVALTKEFVIIRAAIGAPLVRRIHAAEQGDAEDLAEVRREDEALVSKLHALLCAWPSSP